MTYVSPFNGGRINATIGGNTAGAGALVSTGTMTLAGGNNVTLSQNGNGITISGAGAGAAFSAGLSNLGNTSGVTGMASNQMVLAGGNNITLSQSTAVGGNTLTISAANQTVQTQNMFDMTLSGNTAGAMTPVSSGTLTLAGGNNITLSQNGNAVTISGAGGGGANPVHSFYQNLMPQNSAQPYTSLAVTFNTLVVQPLSPVEGYGFPGDMTVSTFMMHMSGSQTATSAASVWSSSFSSSVSIGIYLLNNSSQLTLVNSVSTSWSAPANSQNSTLWAGPRFLTIHSSNWSSQPVLSYGARYWFGVLHGSSNFNNMGPAWLGQYLGASTQRSGTIGVSQTPNTSQGMVPFLGIYSAGLSSMPTSLANSQINKVHALAGFTPGVMLNATFSAF